MKDLVFKDCETCANNPFCVFDLTHCPLDEEYEKDGDEE